MSEQVLGTDPGDGISGTGVTLSGAVTGAIGMITKVGLTGQEADQIDITTCNSPDKWRKFIAGLKDAKEISLDLIWHPENMSLALEVLGGANERWNVNFPDGSLFHCEGFLKANGQQVPNGDKITQSITIKLSGKPVFNEASGA